MLIRISKDLYFHYLLKNKERISNFKIMLIEIYEMILLSLHKSLTEEVIDELIINFLLS